MTVLTPVAGVLADRLPRRLILIVTQLVQAAAAFALWLLYLSDSLTAWRIVGLVFVGGIAGGFQMAAWQAFVPTLVPRSQLVEAVRLNSLQFTVSRALGPSIGAMIGELLGYRPGHLHQRHHLSGGRCGHPRDPRQPSHRERETGDSWPSSSRERAT